MQHGSKYELNQSPDTTSCKSVLMDLKKIAYQISLISDEIDEENVLQDSLCEVREF